MSSALTTRITLRVPSDYHNEPIISRLVSHYGLTVNIAAAMMGEDVQEEGWFKLELTGTAEQVQAGLAYLRSLNLQVWEKANLFRRAGNTTSK